MQPTQRRLANAIRALAMDAVEAANSGHPGMPMGMADAATALFTRHLKYDPADPKWPDRDRFVLSAGHGSMLIYALLYLTGYARPTLEDIRNFRQLNSPCAGHPENFELPGVEVTTGPLGQGLAMAVGMAIAERHLNAIYGDDLVDHRTFVIAGDGDLMEGVNHEAVGLAGPFEARPADRAVGRQPNHHRRVDRSVAQRGCRGAPRGVRLADARGRRARGGQGRPGDRESDRRRAADADPLQDDHRLWRAQQAGHGGDPWRGAGQGRGRSRAQGAWARSERIHRARRCARRVAQGRPARRCRSMRSGTGGSMPAARRPSSSPAWRARPAATG